MTFVHSVRIKRIFPRLIMLKCRPMWCWRNGLIQIMVVGLLSSAVSADSSYRLVPPEVYVVFGGDLELQFHMPGSVSLPNAFVQLQGRRPRDNVWVEITSMGLPLGRKTGALVVACGVVEFAGRYSLTMFMQVDGPVLTQVLFTAVWPPTLLRLPDTHFALMSAVTMEIESNSVCDSRLQREFLTLELYFQRTGNFSRALGVLSIAEKISADNITSIGNEFTKWIYPCEVFDLDGFYQALLKSSSGTTLTVSNVMTSTFSASYHLSSQRASVFPCARGSTLNLLYTRPSCSGLGKFRLLKLVTMAAGSMASPVDRVYAGEFEIDPDRNRVRFGCSLFEPDAMGYCFVYVTVSKFGAVVEQNELCLPAKHNAVLPQDGGWNSWSPWTPCSVTCGIGKRDRFRICNNPFPEHGGRYCHGKAVQWSHCQAHCTDELPRTPLQFLTIDPSCHCGCTKTADLTKDFGLVTATGRCKGLAVWVIKTLSGHRLTLTFNYYDIMYAKQWVKVRDGTTDVDDLLFYSRALQWSRPPLRLTSSGNALRVELMTSEGKAMMSLRSGSSELQGVFPRHATLPIHVHGFIASYTVTIPDEATLSPSFFRHVPTSVMASDVTIVGLVIVVLVTVTVIVFLVVLRKQRGLKPKYAAAKCEEIPAHHKECSSGQSSQASSPGLEVQVDMEIPLTGGNDIRRKSSSGQHASSRTSSISSTCSNGLKKLRTMAAETAGSLSDKGGVAETHDGSPRPSTKKYKSLETLEDASVQKDHKIVQTISPKATPQSPKVLPHRLKASPGTPVYHLLSPSLTKQEMLTRKRLERQLPSPREKMEARPDVMGASWSAESSGASPTPYKTIIKADINSAQTSVTPSCFRSPTVPPLSRDSSDSLLRASAHPVCLSNRAEKSRWYSRGGKSPRKENIPLIDSVEELQHHQTVSDHQEPVTYEETSFISNKMKVRRPTSLVESYSLKTIGTKPKKSNSRTPKSLDVILGKPSAMEERQTLLPKPDGQSPKSFSGEMDKEKDSQSSSPSKSSGFEARTENMSSSHSIASPELEYDDFIMDDPLSYFEYEELNRLNWTGTEKINRNRHKEET